jgi:hypothetical protein
MLSKKCLLIVCFYLEIVGQVGLGFFFTIKYKNNEYAVKNYNY